MERKYSSRGDQMTAESFEVYARGIARALEIFAVHFGLRLVRLQKFTCRYPRVQFLHSLAAIPRARRLSELPTPRFLSGSALSLVEMPKIS
jgi:hypothetical protein